MNTWSVGQRSETGFVRAENQDRMSWIRARAADIFVVSDGMGGHAGGALAAQLTVETLQRKLADFASLDGAAATLESAFQAANDAVFARGQSSNPATARMGATAVALLASGNQVMLAHVGDSRAYLLDRRGTLQRLTKDHSLVQRMVDANVLSEAEAANHPDASVLERAMGQAPRVEVEVSGWLRVHPGEACMLCSDGLCGYVEDDAIASVMRSGHAPQQTADALVRLALERGGEDNVTVQVLRYGARQAPWRRWVLPGVIAAALAALALALALGLGLGWLGTQSKRFSADDEARRVNDAASKAASTTPASAAASDARLVTLEARVQENAANQRAADADLDRELDELRGRIDRMEKRLDAGSHAGAHVAPRAESARKAARTTGARAAAPSSQHQAVSAAPASATDAAEGSP